MNELSTEVKAKETHERAVSHFNVAEQFTYKFIMDVKEIRDNRYYKELGYSNFDDYCKDSWNVDRKYMSERISIAEKFNESDFVGYNRQFGHRKTLLLSRMEESERKRAINEGVPTEQGNKPLEEATQKEIAEWKKRTEQAESQLKAEQKERERLEKENEELANKEPEVIEKVIEDETKINKLQKEIEKMSKEKEDLEHRMSLEKKDAETYRELKRDIDNLRTRKDDIVRQIDNASSIGKFIARVERSFEEDLAPIKYSRAIEELERSEAVQESLEKIVSKVEGWCREIRGLMRDNNIVEVIEHE